MAAFFYMLTVIAELLEGTAQLVRFFTTTTSSQTDDANQGQDTAQRHNALHNPKIATAAKVEPPRAARAAEAARITLSLVTAHREPWQLQ